MNNEKVDYIKLARMLTQSEGTYFTPEEVARIYNVQKFLIELGQIALGCPECRAKLKIS